MGPKPYSTYKFGFLSLTFTGEFESRVRFDTALRVLSASARFCLSLAMLFLAFSMFFFSCCDGSFNLDG